MLFRALMLTLLPHSHPHQAALLLTLPDLPRPTAHPHAPVPHDCGAPAELAGLCDNVAEHLFDQEFGDPTDE